MAGAARLTAGPLAGCARTSRRSASADRTAADCRVGGLARANAPPFGQPRDRPRRSRRSWASSRVRRSVQLGLRRTRGRRPARAIGAGPSSAASAACTRAVQLGAGPGVEQRRSRRAGTCASTVLPATHRIAGLQLDAQHAPGDRRRDDEAIADARLAFLVDRDLRAGRGVDRRELGRHRRGPERPDERSRRRTTTTGGRRTPSAVAKNRFVGANGAMAAIRALFRTATRSRRSSRRRTDQARDRRPRPASRRRGAGVRRRPMTTSGKPIQLGLEAPSRCAPRSRSPITSPSGHGRRASGAPARRAG